MGNQRALLRATAFVEAAVVKLMITMATTVLEFLQPSTPIRTGHARASYTVGVNQTAPGFPETSSADFHRVPSPQEIVSAGSAGLRAGDDLIIGNRAAHAVLILEHGVSPQAPEPVVVAAVTAAARVVNSLTGTFAA